MLYWFHCFVGLVVNCSKLVVSHYCRCFNCHLEEECIVACQLLVAMHNQDMGGNWIINQVKKFIWIYSSRVNHRHSVSKNTLKALWDDLLRASMTIYEEGCETAIGLLIVSIEIEVKLYLEWPKKEESISLCT